ncbi:MAG: methyltransferase [Candidatus Binatia bacterium]|nr:methyltransferase [Candidatus Binatia bacterium]
MKAAGTAGSLACSGQDGRTERFGGQDRFPSFWRRYALVWEPWRCGRASLRVARVADLARHVDVEALLRDPHAPEPPYWAHLWVGSRALARYLVEHPWLPAGRCLEVGCGLGLVSLVSAQMGGQAFAFDHDADAVGLCRLNAVANDLRVHLWQGDLQRFALRERFELICAADVTYDPALQTALLDLAWASLGRGGCLVAAESVRTFDRAWLAEAQARGFAVHEVRVMEMEDARPVEVRLVVMRWR